MERLKVRQIGESKTHGVPLVMSVTVTAYQQYLIHGVCSTCDWWIYRNRWLAWLLGLGPIALVLGIAAAQESEALGLLGGVMAIFLMRGLFYSWIDDQVWGQKVIQKLGFPPGDYHIPASALHVLVRGVGGPWLAIMAVALIAVALGK